MKATHYIWLIVASLLLASCEWHLKPFEEDGTAEGYTLHRYDVVESRYLTTGDFSALQQMNTRYAMPTRVLIEDVLQLGTVDDAETNSRLLAFFQDSLLQTIVSDVEHIYTSTDDVEAHLQRAFARLAKLLPDSVAFSPPLLYTQIGALNQSIIVGEGILGISLDKYLGADYPAYQHFYTEHQRQTLTREYIVPDCMVFYLLSHYPLADFENRSQADRESHMGRIMYAANQLLDKPFFHTPHVEAAEEYAAKHRLNPIQLLTAE